MAAYDYSKLAATAASLLARFGVGGCSVVRPTATVADPTKPWKGTATADAPVLSGVSVVVENLTTARTDAPWMPSSRSAEANARSPFLTLGARAVAFMADASLVRDGDVLVVPTGASSVRYGIMHVEPVRPGGTAVLWQLLLRD